MNRSGIRAIRQLVSAVFLTTLAGCAPTVDVVGVYFPGWLVSAVTGVAASYGIVVWLARRPDARGLANSGLLFVSLVVGSSLALWWALFSGF